MCYQWAVYISSCFIKLIATSSVLHEIHLLGKLIQICVSFLTLLWVRKPKVKQCKIDALIQVLNFCTHMSAHVSNSKSNSQFNYLLNHSHSEQPTVTIPFRIQWTCSSRNEIWSLLNWVRCPLLYVSPSAVYLQYTTYAFLVLRITHPVMRFVMHTATPANKFETCSR